ARSEIVPMGKSSREHQGIHVGKGRIAVPHDLGVTAKQADGFDHVVLAIGPGEKHDADAGHEGVTATAKSSMTGLVRNRLHSSSTRPRAVPSSSASTVKRRALPTRTPSMPSNPRVGSDRSIVDPC